MLAAKESSGTASLPMMPIRDVVVFPYTMMPFVVGRESSLLAVQDAVAVDKMMFLAAQRDASAGQPGPGGIFSAGCIVRIVQSMKLPDGNIKVLVEGVERAKAVSVNGDEGFFRAVVHTFPSNAEAVPGLDELIRGVTSLFELYAKLSQHLNYETMAAAIGVDDPGRLADAVGANLQLTMAEKQELLEIFDPADRLTRVAELLDIEIAKLAGYRIIEGRVRRQMEKAQKS
jgi:ATP-dependent Lon protease